MRTSRKRTSAFARKFACCARLECPFGFAILLREGGPDSSHGKMQAILDGKQSTQINLPARMPVLLTYWTAWVGDSVVQLREDPYGRDGRVREPLDR